MNGLGLAPGYYLGRLANSFGGLPVYEVGDRNSSSTPSVLAEEMRRNGAHVGTRPAFNFIEGANIGLTAADNPATNACDLTINAVVTSEEMRKNGVHVGTRPAFNFVEGQNVTLAAADNPVTGACDLTIAATSDVVVIQVLNIVGPPPSPGVTGQPVLTLIDKRLWIWTGVDWLAFCPCDEESGSGMGAAWYCLEAPGSGSGSGSGSGGGIAVTPCCPDGLANTLHVVLSCRDCPVLDGAILDVTWDGSRWLVAGVVIRDPFTGFPGTANAVLSCTGTQFTLALEYRGETCTIDLYLNIQSNLLCTPLTLSLGGYGKGTGTGCCNGGNTFAVAAHVTD